MQETGKKPTATGMGLSHLLDLGSDDEEEKKRQILEQLEQQVVAHSEGVAHVEKKQRKKVNMKITKII